MTTATIPTGGRASVLAELRRRRDTALDLLYAAEEAGNERKWRAATERLWLRELQIDAVSKRPEGDTCPRCEWGEDGWPAQALLSYERFSACLEHATENLEREAAAMSKAARWMGGDGLMTPCWIFRFEALGYPDTWWQAPVPDDLDCGAYGCDLRPGAGAWDHNCVYDYLHSMCNRAQGHAGEHAFVKQNEVVLVCAMEPSA